MSCKGCGKEGHLVKDCPAAASRLNESAYPSLNAAKPPTKNEQRKINERNLDAIKDEKKVGEHAATPAPLPAMNPHQRPAHPHRPATLPNTRQQPPFQALVLFCSSDLVELKSCCFGGPLPCLYSVVVNFLFYDRKIEN